MSDLAHPVRMGENGNMLRKTAVRYKGKVDSAGRVLIPAELREKMDVKPGTMVTITGGRGRIVVESRSAAVRAAQKYFRSLGPESEALVRGIDRGAAPGGAAGTCGLKACSMFWTALNKTG